MNSVNQAAGWPPDPSAAPPPMAPDLSAQAAQDDDSEPQGYFVGECGHRVPGGPAYYVGGPYGECGPEADGSWAIHGLGAPGVRLSKAR